MARRGLRRSTGIKADWDNHGPKSVATVMELIGLDAAAEQALWQWVFWIDLVGIVRTWRGPVPHPLQLMITEPRRLATIVSDGMWLRIIDLPAALEGRSYRGPGSLVFEVTDDFCPWNAGTWQLAVPESDGVAKVTGAARRAGPRRSTSATWRRSTSARSTSRDLAARRPREGVPPGRDRRRRRAVRDSVDPVELDDVLVGRIGARSARICPIDDLIRSR